MQSLPGAHPSAQDYCAALRRCLASVVTAVRGCVVDRMQVDTWTGGA
jgi:hypothetical protein